MKSLLFREEFHSEKTIELNISFDFYFKLINGTMQFLYNSFLKKKL